MKEETICALCTPKGKGALSLIRISGPKAFKITKKIASFLPQKPESHKAYFGNIKHNKELLDQVLITYFAKGRSFTGEESLEIACHGGAIYNEILKALLDSGARLAERGEFSLQAFSNNKMDLTQAEGLLQLIESESWASRRQAFFQLKGRLSKSLLEIEKKWLFLLSHLEADIDFSLEDIPVFKERQIKKALEDLKLDLKNLLSRYKPFENLQKGLIFGLFGLTNSGKSSLFNALLGEEKAIVSKEEGTTRDLVEGKLFNPKGLNISLIDSAGFRESKSEGENKGQNKAKELFLRSDYKLILLDSACPEPLEEKLFSQPSTSLIVWTKKDLSPQKSLKGLIARLKKKQKNLKLPPKDQVFFVSSKTGEAVLDLKKKILSYGLLDQEEFLISNYRHYKGLKKMEESLSRALDILTHAQAERDLMALELRQGLVALYEILGKQIEDDVLDNIFKQFCIGK